MIIYGWKRYAQVLAVLTLVCQQCHLPAEHVLRRLTTKFTLFFIPLFPISRKHTLTCVSCSGENKVTREQAEQLIASGAQHAPGPQPGPRQFAGPPTPPPQPAYGQPQQYYGAPTPPAQPAYGQYGQYSQYPAQPGPYAQPPQGYHQGPPMRPYPGR